MSITIPSHRPLIAKRITIDIVDFCSGHLDRLIPIAQINLRDVNLAIAEVERVKNKVKGLFYTPFPTNGILMGAAYCAPFWACVEASGLPISGPSPTGFSGCGLSACRSPRTRA